VSRNVSTAAPIEGDYILSFTGLSWNVLKKTGQNSALTISAGEKNRKTALAHVRSLTEADAADGWEADGPDAFRQITRFRR
jgi:hypothetical protein